MFVDKGFAVCQAFEGTKVKSVVQVFVDSALGHAIAREADGDEEQGKHRELPSSWWVRKLVSKQKRRTSHFAILPTTCHICVRNMRMQHVEAAPAQWTAAKERILVSER